ncbi:hypothetical protein HPB48_001070 [Haemaphysalis longicornis]|uniref:Uncharacterized protein n=1 Tax=Haemaphysalis longicornis TaxID=44386 RepID=A0A9J6H141_HAELO|nr:hypothetical protein HPB48_001070 [Haemaphysalis longicornis]
MSDDECHGPNGRTESQPGAETGVAAVRRSAEPKPRGSGWEQATCWPTNSCSRFMRPAAVTTPPPAGSSCCLVGGGSCLWALVRIGSQSKQGCNQAPRCKQKVLIESATDSSTSTDSEHMEVPSPLLRTSTALLLPNKDPFDSASEVWDDDGDWRETALPENRFTDEEAKIAEARVSPAFLSQLSRRTPDPVLRGSVHKVTGGEPSRRPYRVCACLVP